MNSLTALMQSEDYNLNVFIHSKRSKETSCLDNFMEVDDTVLDEVTLWQTHNAAIPTTVPKTLSNDINLSRGAQGNMNGHCVHFIADATEGREREWKGHVTKFNMINGTSDQYEEFVEVEAKSCSTRADDIVAIYRQDSEGDTLLHKAIIMADKEKAIAYISMAPNNSFLSLKNKLYQTPLHLAVITRQLEVAKGLVVSGADLETGDKDGNTALHIACRDGIVEIVEILIQIKQKEHEAGPCRSIQKLSAVNYDGLSCVHLAALNGHTNVVQALSKVKCDVNERERKTGRTALHIACSHGNVDLVRLLLSLRTCDMNARTYDKITPFDVARDAGHEDVCLALASNGARYGYVDYDSD